MDLAQRWRFLKGYVRQPHVVGALGPSSTALASALCEPFHRYPRPARVLEVGAGTGAITRYLGSILGDEDELDVCEIKSEFADILRREVLSRPDFASGVSSGRVRLVESAVQALPHENHYDFVISCLPLNAFELRDVEEIFTVLRRCLKPGGVLSYFEYIAFRRGSTVFSLGRRRQRIRSVSAYMTNTIKKFQFHRRTVLGNFPPACARFLRFDSLDSSLDHCNRLTG